MTDLFELLDQMRRPRLLIQAARAGAEDYNRTPHLRRLLRAVPLPANRETLLRLIELEAELDRQRCAGDTGYSLVAHVDTLIALMGEARLARACQAEPA